MFGLLIKINRSVHTAQLPYLLFYLKLYKNLNFWRQIFAILIIHNPSLESCEVPKKFEPGWFSHFDVYQLQTDRQTSKEFTAVYERNISKTHRIALHKDW